MRILRDEVTPTQALAKPPMLLNILYHNTNVPPMEPILTAAKQLEERPDVLVANVAVGYPYADVHEIGPSFVVVTDDITRNSHRRKPIGYPICCGMSTDN